MEGVSYGTSEGSTVQVLGTTGTKAPGKNLPDMLEEKQRQVRDGTTKACILRPLLPSLDTLSYRHLFFFFVPGIDQHTPIVAHLISLEQRKCCPRLFLCHGDRIEYNERDSIVPKDPKTCTIWSFSENAVSCSFLIIINGGTI
jgi:hypothetical protein